MIQIYTDGACDPNPGGPGGWAAILIEDGQQRALYGSDESTTNNRMELLAAIKGLEATPAGSDVTLWSDSEYLVKTMTQGWRRRANTDLWQLLDHLVAARSVRWEWVRGHAGHVWNEEADRLAQGQARAVRNRGKSGQGAVLNDPGLRSVTDPTLVTTSEEAA